MGGTDRAKDRKEKYRKPFLRAERGPSKFAVSGIKGL
jgi:hypothetical protein